jgi:capsular polysaccharide export protein
MNLVESKPFLRIPPFPGARAASLVGAVPSAAPLGSDVADLVAAIRQAKVGGDYWAKQPALPTHPYTLVRVADSASAETFVAADGQVLLWNDKPSVSSWQVSGSCDPWHLLKNAKRVIVDADDEVALIAAIVGVSVETVGSGRFSDLSDGDASSVEDAVSRHVAAVAHVDPFTGEQIAVSAAVRLCGFWRDLIDRNRGISAALGFAFWKRPTVAPLLWAGEAVPFASDLKGAPAGAVAIWKSRTPPQMIQSLEDDGVPLIEVEDGFIRSTGLGADCVPPLSIVVDRQGIHFDPSQPSDLEDLLQNGSFDDEILSRARDLRDVIVASGVSKYGSGSALLSRRVPDRRHVLVPGQVEDDRSVLSGGGPVSGNLDLLKRARAEAPDAFIIYKPHPDVEAGHRVGGIPEAECLNFADEVVRDQPISALIDLADELHVNTSLAGFEALLRSKLVTTHGIPFYAGWGLTRDLGPVPGRRTAKRTLDELVAAVLLIYPRYLDPVTGLPCPPEILVHRIAEGGGVSQGGAVVQLRRFQGRWKKRLAGLGSR